jgi:MFS family permease
MLKLSDGRNFARTFTGLALIAGPLLLLIAQLVGPDTDHGGSVQDKLKELSDVASSKGAYLTSGILFLLAGLVLAAGAVGLIHYFRGRKVTLGQIASAMVAMGAAASMVFYGYGSVEYEMVNHSNLNRDQMAQLLHATSMPASGAPVFLMFVIGVVLGLILLGIACWRTRVVPVWASLLIAAAGILAFFGPGKAVSIASFVVLTAGLGTLGLTVLRSSDESWDAPRDQLEVASASAPPEEATPA